MEVIFYTVFKWDVEIQPVGNVQPLLDAMVAKIEEVYKNRSQKQA